MKDQQILSAISAGSIEHIEILVEKHEPKVLQMAKDLTGSEEQARTVCEQVFVEICRASLAGSAEQLEAMLHRFTYELAIASLLGNVEDSNSEIKEVFGQLVGEAPVTTVYETSDDLEEIVSKEAEVKESSWEIAETHVQLSELANAALSEVH